MVAVHNYHWHLNVCKKQHQSVTLFIFNTSGCLQNFYCRNIELSGRQRLICTFCHQYRTIQCWSPAVYVNIVYKKKNLCIVETVYAQPLQWPNGRLLINWHGQKLGLKTLLQLIQWNDNNPYSSSHAYICPLKLEKMSR